MQPQLPPQFTYNSPNSFFVPSTKPTSQQQTKPKKKTRLEQAFQILTKLCPTKEELKRSEKIIEAHFDYKEILHELFQLVLKYNRQKNQTLVKVVITQIDTYMYRQTSQYYKSKHDRFMINKKFLEFFITQNGVDQKYKKMLQNQFMKFINFHQNLKIRQDNVIFIQNKFLEVLSASKQTMKALEDYKRLQSPIEMFIPPVEIVTEANFNLVKSLIHVLKCLLKGENLQHSYLEKILPLAFMINYRMTLELVKKIILAIKNKQQFIFNQGVEDCVRFMEIMSIIFSKLDSDKFHTLRQKIMHTKQVHRLLLVLLNINTHFQINQQIEIIISSMTIAQGGIVLDKQKKYGQTINQVTNLIKSLKFRQNFLQLHNDNIKQVSQNILSIKKFSLQMLIKFVNILVKKKEYKVQQCYPYLSAILGPLWIEIKDCMLLKTEQHLKNLQTNPLPQQKLSNNKQITQLIASILSFSIKYLGMCIQLPFVYSIVSKYQNQVIFNISFPWLISREEHHKRYDGEDYLFFREEIVNKQEQQHIENIACSLVQGYLNKIDGAVTSILTACMNLITITLAKNKLVDNTIYENINLEAMSNELVHSWAFKFYPIQRQIQASLTLIAIINYLSLKRNDLVLMLQKWIYSHKAFFFQTQNDFRITVQFLLMYSYYVDSFYWNLIKGISQNKYRQFHRQVLKFCCHLMRQNYDYEKNKFKKGITKSSSQILYYMGLDCINNSFSNNQIIPALYFNFPSKSSLKIPDQIGTYDNYPYYPPISNQLIKKITPFNKKSQNIQKIQEISSFDPLNKSSKKGKNQNVKQLQENILTFYTKIGLNKIQYIYSKQIIEIMQFLSENLFSQGDLKIIQFFIEFLKNYLRGEIQNQGQFINIPIVIRDDVAALVSVKTYDLLTKSQKSFLDMGIVQMKAIELIYILHYVSNDPYYIYSLGLEKLWEKQLIWRYEIFYEGCGCDIDPLLKCTDLVARLALKKYSSQKKVNVEQLLLRIANIYTKWCYQYVKKVSKFNMIFGILLNLILLKIQPQKLFDCLFIMIKDKFMGGQIQKLEYYQNQRQSQQSQQQSDQQMQQDQTRKKWNQKINQGWEKMKAQQIKKFQDKDQQWLSQYENVQQLLQQSLYLFLMNVYRNSQYLNTQKNIAIVHTFIQYLKYYINPKGMITQMGDHFGKIFTCIICIIQRQYIQTSALNQYDNFILQFCWDNILHSGKLYKSQLELRIMAIKLLNLIREVIKRNDENFSLQKVQKMYRLAAFCVCKSKSKDILNGEEDDGDFDDNKEREEWENKPITLRNNSTSLYLQDQVLLLKTLTKQLLESPHIQIKQWITKVIQKLPVTIRNFVKNRVMHYEQQSKEIGMRKLIKVKRGVGNVSENSNMKKQTQKYIMKKKKNQACDEQPANEGQKDVGEVSANSNMKKQTQEYSMKKQNNQKCDEQPVNESQIGVGEVSKNSNMKKQVQEYIMKKQNNQKCDEQPVNEGQKGICEVSENSNTKNQIQEKKNNQMCDEQPANEG